MPHKPAKPCAFPGCPRLTHEKYCEMHQYMKQKETRQYNQTRSREQRDRYNNSEWIKIRENFITEHPFCSMCRSMGRLRKADIVHHITPLAEGGTNDESNLVSLCISCHNQVHGRRGDYKKKYKVYTY